jgi:hypothetical protein
VILDAGYGPSALIHPFANDVTVAELTLSRARDHLVHAYPAPGGPDLRGLLLYRVRMVDSGEQFLKANSNAARSAWVDAGTVACSQFLMTPTGRQNIERAFGCYTGGIDVHSGRGWRVRDSVFEGIYCEDGEVAEHAIHFWKGARGTLVENNLVRNCARAIGFGLGDSGEGRAYPDDPYPGLGFIGHYDGVIRGNALLADIPQYDTGIELAQARGARVLHNTLVETARATGSFSSIDYRWPNTSVAVANNLTRRITARDGGQAGTEPQRRGHARGVAGESGRRGLPSEARPERSAGQRCGGGGGRPGHRRPSARLRRPGHRGGRVVASGGRRVTRREAACAGPAPATTEGRAAGARPLYRPPP